MKFSKRFALNIEDILKGGIMAAGGAVYAIVEPYFTAGNFEIDWPNVGKIAFGTGLVYVLRKFFSGEPKTVYVDPEKTKVMAK